jgi:hypothetical protein
MKAELESLTIYPDSFAIDATLRIDFFGAERTLKLSGSLQQADAPVVTIAATAAAKILSGTVTLPTAKRVAAKRATQTVGKRKAATDTAAGGSDQGGYESWQDSILAVLSRDTKDAFTKTELFDHVLMRRHGKDMRGNKERKERNGLYGSFWSALKVLIKGKIAREVEQDGLPKVTKGNL